MARWPWSRPLPPPPPPPPALYELILAWAPPLWLCCCACCFALVACVLAWAWRVAERFHWRWPVSPRGLRKLLGTVFRLLVQKRACQLGQLTGLALPIRASDLTGPGGAAALDAMLRHGGHLPAGTRVSAVQLADGPGVTDGVKGDKHVLLVSYAGLSSVPVTLPPPPSQLFAKFSIGRRLHPMRVLSDCTETARCEATFYAQVATEAESCGLGSPTCYFADYCQSTGESCLLLEILPFEGSTLFPLRHRIRHPPSLPETRAIVSAGARLNARFWGKGGGGATCMRGVPSYAEINEARVALAQILGLRTLAATARRSLAPLPITPAFMTWEPPPGIIGAEAELIALLPEIAAALCAETATVAYGHNDAVSDNAYFWRDTGGGGHAGGAAFGLFDWQQACINNVGHEWAWNFHFLPPEFLEEHEHDLIELILRTYAAHGVVLPKERFCRSYALACALLYVWGGGAMQPLLRRVHAAGLLDTLAPNDARHATGWPGVSRSDREALLGAEMTRRTLTNACGIMRRHGFVQHWAEWRRGVL